MSERVYTDQTVGTWHVGHKEGIAAAALVCRRATDPDDRDDLLAMLGLGTINELHNRIGKGAESFNLFPLNKGMKKLL